MAARELGKTTIRIGSLKNYREKKDRLMRELWKFYRLLETHNREPEFRLSTPTRELVRELTKTEPAAGKLLEADGKISRYENVVKEVIVGGAFIIAGTVLAILTSQPMWVIGGLISGLIAVTVTNLFGKISALRYKNEFIENLEKLVSECKLSG